MTEESTKGESEGESLNDKSKENKQKDWVTQTLRIVSIISAGVGLFILLWFLFALWQQYTVFGSNEILLEKTAQVGDFIGGLVGSIWAFTGVLLFYLALRLQRKEFEENRKVLQSQAKELAHQHKELGLQRKELKNQRKEFQINHITNVIYKQLEKIDRVVDNFEYVIESPNNQTREVFVGIYALEKVSQDFYEIGKYLDEVKANVRNPSSPCIVRLREHQIYQSRLINLLVTIRDQINLPNSLLRSLKKSKQSTLKKIITYNFETNLILVLSDIHALSEHKVLPLLPNDDNVKQKLKKIIEAANELLEAIDKFDEGAKERILAIG